MLFEVSAWAVCRFCRSEPESSCDTPSFTGYQLDGGFATRVVACASCCFRQLDAYADIHVALLLRAGLIDYRALKAAGQAERLGIYGFGAAAHIVTQIARHRGIAPKRFNPSGEAWLPVLHVRRGEWFFTVLFSNTQRAHDLGKTHDWVIIYLHTEHDPEAQWAVVTEARGPLEGRRVVRGWEGECIAHYAAIQQLQTS